MEANFTTLEKLILLAVLFLAIIFALAGCGSTTERATKTVEREEWVFGPMVAETWLGAVTIQPTRVVHQRVEDEVQKTEKTINVPDPTPIITAAAGGVGPLGIAGTILGLLTTTAAAWKAKQLGQQRDEMIDGIERSKDKMPPEHWGSLTASLEAEQSRDTKAAVKARVG